MSERARKERERDGKERKAGREVRKQAGRQTTSRLAGRYRPVRQGPDSRFILC